MIKFVSDSNDRNKFVEDTIGGLEEFSKTYDKKVTEWCINIKKRIDVPDKQLWNEFTQLNTEGKEILNVINRLSGTCNIAQLHKLATIDKGVKKSYEKVAWMSRPFFETVFKNSQWRPYSEWFKGLESHEVKLDDIPRYFLDEDMIVHAIQSGCECDLNKPFEITKRIYLAAVVKYPDLIEHVPKDILTITFIEDVIKEGGPELEDYFKRLQE